jgi:hypothetical protein
MNPVKPPAHRHNPARANNRAKAKENLPAKAKAKARPLAKIRAKARQEARTRVEEMDPARAEAAATRAVATRFPAMAMRNGATDWPISKRL